MHLGQIARPLIDRFPFICSLFCFLQPIFLALDPTLLSVAKRVGVSLDEVMWGKENSPSTTWVANFIIALFAAPASHSRDVVRFTRSTTDSWASFAIQSVFEVATSLVVRRRSCGTWTDLLVFASTLSSLVDASGRKRGRSSLGSLMRFDLSAPPRAADRTAFLARDDIQQANLTANHVVQFTGGSDFRVHRLFQRYFFDTVLERCQDRTLTAFGVQVTVVELLRCLLPCTAIYIVQFLQDVIGDKRWMATSSVLLVLGCFYFHCNCFRVLIFICISDL